MNISKSKSHPNVKNIARKELEIQETIQEKSPALKPVQLKKINKSLSHPNKKEVKRVDNLDDQFDALDMAYKLLQEQENKNQNKDDDCKCKHENTIDNDGSIICVDCGETLSENICEEAEWRYYGSNDNVESSDPSRCQYTKTVDKGINKELLALGFSNEISVKANELYMIVTKETIKRSNFRKGIMFACVFHSFIMIGKPQTTDYISNILKISKRSISKGFTYYGLNYPKDRLEKQVYITAEHYIPRILNELKVTKEHVEKVLALYNKIKDKSYLLNTSNPQSIGSGFVYYYLKKLNADINPTKFGEQVKLSEITITRIANEIEDIINNDDILY
jgi:transcription initiation factor TFIIIB Brf1 subunit/transcription initiation factor TFIIB